MIEKAKSGIQLESIFLDTSLFNRGDYLETPSLDGKKMDLKLDSIERNDFIDCKVVVEFGDNTNNSDLSILVSMIGIFKKIGDISLSNEEFININAPAVIYPYIRQHVRSLSLDAGLAPIILPMVNFQRMYELNKKDTQDA